MDRTSTGLVEAAAILLWQTHYPDNAAPLQLAGIPFDLAAWDPRRNDDLQLLLLDGDPQFPREASVYGQVEQIAVSRTPEPSAAALTLLGLAGLFAAAVRARF